jgi:hypothetical protein
VPGQQVAQRQHAPAYAPIAFMVGSPGQFCNATLDIGRSGVSHGDLP